MTVPPPPGSAPPPPMPPGPPPGMPPVPPQGGQSASNGMAVASLVLGIISICFGYIAGIPAVILGFLGKKKANETGVGSGQATAGIVLGFIGIAIGVIGTIFWITVGLTADSTLDEIERDIEKSNTEFNEKQSRNGDVASTSDFAITRAEVRVGDYGSVDYSAYIENTADFDTGFTAEIECEGDLGDKESTEVYAYDLAPGDKENITAYFSFAEGTVNVTCEVTEVLYSY